MLVSRSWLEEFISLPAELTAEKLALDITMSIVEVEQVVKQAEQLNDVVVGRVSEIAKHPQADRLWIVKTDIGTETLQVVCGGSNLREGMTVAVAKIGAKVRWHGEGELVALEPAKIRGQQSQGMIVAASEIGLADIFPAQDEHEIIDLSDLRLKVGQPLAQALGLEDTILTIDNKSMTHRPDLWGHYGLARELAALYNLKLKPLKSSLPESAGKNKKLHLDISTDACLRYSALIIDQLEVKASPWWLRARLEALGVRSINNIVDATNYVMLLLGQPMHAFDYAALHQQTIKVRKITREERFQTLDGQVRKVPANSVMIADGQKDIAIAGIMGGENSEIKNNTTCIVLESATFDASHVRQTSMKLGLRSEASARFEKALDPEQTVVGLEIAAQLIKKLCPAAVIAGKIIDQRKQPAIERVLKVEKKLFDRMIGVTLADSEIKDILKRLHFKVVLKRGVFEVTVPSWRATKDITIAEDLVEEVARIYGYDNIPPKLPNLTVEQPERDLERLLQRQIADMLVYGSQYAEVYNYSFADNLWSEYLSMTKNRLELAGTVSEDQQYLRSSLLPALLHKAQDNLRWSNEFKLFEFGRVFRSFNGDYPIDAKGDNFLPEQNKFFAGVIVSRKLTAEQLYLQIKGFLTLLFDHFYIPFSLETKEKPFSFKRQTLRAHDQKFAAFGLLNAELAQTEFKGYQLVWWEINFSKLIKYAEIGRSFSVMPKYPAATRDLAIVVDQSVAWENIIKEIKGSSSLIEQVDLFDIFVSPSLGANKRSLAFSLSIRSSDKTLTADEVDAIIKKVVANLAEKHQAKLR